jgi:hypothetical protein
MPWSDRPRLPRCPPPSRRRAQILPAPPGYQPIYTPARKLMSTPTPMTLGGGATPLYHMPVEDPGMKQVGALVGRVRAGRQERGF